MTTQFAGVPVFLQLAPWMIGVIGLFAAISMPAIARLGTARTPSASLWDIPRVAQMYTTVVGMLAAFAAASAVFVARLGVDQPGEGFETTIGLFVIAFLMLAASAIEFANTPNAVDTDPRFLRTQRFCFLLAQVTLTQGICTSWLGLRSLTLLIGLPGLSDMLGVLLLLIVVLAAARFGQYLLDYTSAHGLVCIITPVVSLGGAIAYLVVADQWMPALRPTEHEALQFAFVGGLLAAFGFTLQSTLFTLHTQDMCRPLLDRIEPMIVGYTQVTAASFCLLAITVVGS